MLATNTDAQTAAVVEAPVAAPNNPIASRHNSAATIWPGKDAGTRSPVDGAGGAAGGVGAGVRGTGDVIAIGHLAA
jgi:hypothetical protein